jgi:cytochrome b
MVSVRRDESGTDPAPPMVRVWDPFVRVFHWSLVALFTLAFLTGDWLGRLHEAIGYAIAALIPARFVWGFVGTRYARFGDFVRPWPEVTAYLRAALSLRAPRFLGHNPAGGLMIVAMLAMLALSCLSGWSLTTDALRDAEWLAGLHEALANVTLMLVPLHLAGVAFNSLVHGENLVRAMLTGDKRAPADNN